MPKAVVDIVDCATVNRTGASFRKARPGPELDLIESFLSEFPFEVPRGCRATLFREPRLDSGFPDLVFVAWHPGTMQEWSEARAKLKKQDLQLLQYLLECSPADEIDLRLVFPNGIVASLARLDEARLVRRVHQQWVPRAIAKSFAVRQIVAIEAKISDWQSAAKQAHLNTWFTAESYVLMPQSMNGHPLLAAATALDIGVLSQADGVVRKPGQGGALPRSYASWLFNEWAYLQCLRAQCNLSALQTFDDTVSEHERLLNDAESIIHTLSAAGVRGQLRDFNEIIDVNRAALSVLTTTRGPILRRAWTSM
jgi:hypothetical protein